MAAGNQNGHGNKNLHSLLVGKGGGTITLEKSLMSYQAKYILTMHTRVTILGIYLKEFES